MVPLSQVAGVGSVPNLTMLSHLRRIRAQYGLGLLVTLLCPFLARPDLAIGEHLLVSSQRNTILAGIVAMTLGFLVVRRLHHYPGCRIATAVLPVMMATFALSTTVLVLLRADYSRVVLLSTFAGAVVCYTTLFLVLSQRLRWRFLVVPFGEATSVGALRQADWYRLESGSLPDFRFDGIVADLRCDLPPEWEAFIAEAAIQGVPVYHEKQIREMFEGKVRIDHLSENSFGSLIPNAIYARVKRMLDVGMTLVLLPLIVPLLVGTALVVAVDAWLTGDRGPVVFRQRRMGYRGTPFTIWKFRTMRSVPIVGCALEGAMTRDGDARITRVGHVLRRSRLDELLQVVNILRGEMSWIGPRPEAVPLSEHYEGALGFYRYRHIVRPGLTGWAQVNQGHVTSTDDVLNKLQYDFYYIKHLSAWLDMEICARTVRTVMTGNGAR